MLGVVQLELKIVNELVKHHPLGITLQMLSNSLILLNTTNCNVDKRNSDFDRHENEKKDRMLKCYCGREFTTVCSLNVHKRSCHIFDVSEISNLITGTTEENNPGSEVEIEIETVPKNFIKPGIKLPKMTRSGSKQMISLETRKTINVLTIVVIHYFSEWTSF